MLFVNWHNMQLVLVPFCMHTPHFKNKHKGFFVNKECFELYSPGVRDKLRWGTLINQRQCSHCLVSRHDLRVGSGYSSTLPSPEKQLNPSAASHLCSHSLLCREQCADDNQHCICSTVNLLKCIFQEVLCGDTIVHRRHKMVLWQWVITIQCWGVTS